MTVPSQLSELWDSLAEGGWRDANLQGASIYPMPGDARFDRDELFVNVPLFPLADGGVVYVRDDVWESPLAWHREHETRRRAWLKQKFRIHGDCDRKLIDSIKTNVKRCVYLELFSRMRPLSLSAVSQRRQFYVKLGLFAISRGRSFSELDFVDLAVFVDGLPQKLRDTVPAIYDTLRLWKGRAPASYTMFQPPPSLRAFEDAANADGDSAHGGLDVDTIRDDAGPSDIERRWQPFPDAFVAAAGEFCLRVLDDVRPSVNQALRELRRLPAPTAADISSIAKSQTWPEGFRAASQQDLRSLANLCQTAAIFILSLLLGPRWEEVSAMPLRTVITRRVTGGRRQSFVKGSTFKFSRSSSGKKRDWPICPDLDRIIRGQKAYIVIAEGKEFPFLWRNSETILDSREPKRQIDSTLKKFSKRWGFEPLLGGTSCHHHRFRKTTARLIMIALHGGPSILRRLFGHENLAMTLRYILSNEGIIEELREIAEEEQRLIAIAHVEKADSLRGGGAGRFQDVVSRLKEELNVNVPVGKRDQARVGAADIVELLASGPDGFSIKQILPGLISCFKQSGEAGVCSSENELPNVTKCSADCAWHVSMPEFVGQARANVEDALSHMRNSEPGSLIWVHYERVVRQRLRAFPELTAEFSGDPIVADLLEVVDG
jgi:integrase